jgi:DNA repair exonuclease SbcCD ATPase subunit
MAKLNYNKPMEGKILIRGGPRDMQRRQQLIEQEQVIRSIVQDDSKGPRPTMRGEKEFPASLPQNDVDLSQYLPLSEVQIKIEQAVEYTRNEEKNRYESGLKSLNEQLKESRKKASLADEQLINANSDIRRLKSQLSEIPSSSPTDLDKIKNQETTITKLKAEAEAQIKMIEYLNVQLRIKSDGFEKMYKIANDDLQGKAAKIAELEQKISGTESSNSSIKDLEDKLDKLYLKIADGSISPLVGSRMDRPALEDKIFIDPIDKGQEPKLESHIEVEETPTTEVDRDVSSDLAKLRNLLKI